MLRKYFPFIILNLFYLRSNENGHCFGVCRARTFKKIEKNFFRLKQQSEEKRGANQSTIYNGRGQKIPKKEEEPNKVQYKEGGVINSKKRRKA